MNKNEIKLQKNNSNRDWSDLEWIQEFHSFLQGDIPEGISLGDEYKVKLTPEQSSTGIWSRRPKGRCSCCPVRAEC